MSSAVTGDAVNEVTALAYAAAEPEQVDQHAAHSASVYVVPAGYRTEVVDLEAIRAPLRPGPRLKSGSYQTTDVASFLLYYDKHAGDDAEIWVGDSAVVAVLDAHGAADNRWEAHTVSLKLRHSPEWQRWSAASGRLMRQQEFAEFVEDCAMDVVDPDAATMLEVASSLTAATKVDFKSAYRTRDGQTAFRYEETTTAKAGSKGELEIPARLGLRLRVFMGQDPVMVSARFRYRIGDGGLQLGFVLDRVSETVEASRDAVVDQITEGVARGLVFRGVTAP